MDYVCWEPQVASLPKMWLYRHFYFAPICFDFVDCGLQSGGWNLSEGVVLVTGALLGVHPLRMSRIFSCTLGLTDLDFDLELCLGHTGLGRLSVLEFG